ncbi:hypothetical protein AVEN_35145-1 [Araneus ventricosus]|uniref:Uncharacterized protein n=1 Tax=Araneus ventricosus TaxID=182803 RepID=A0A4Y2HC23_ARAVE|nr:hypothetical protein AVEN_35145-1 [Araneus ventricosus]
MRCVYYCFMKRSEFSLKYGAVVVESSRPLVELDVIGQDAEGSSNSVFDFRDIRIKRFLLYVYLVISHRRSPNDNGYSKFYCT